MQGNGIDLSALDTKKGAEEGFKLDLRHPKTNEPLGIWIHVLGADSETYHEQMREFRRRRTELLKRNMRATFSPEEAEAEGLDLLASVTRAWSEHMMLDGEKLIFSTGAARKLYERFAWIREQVDASIHERGNFLPGNGTSS